MGYDESRHDRGRQTEHGRGHSSDSSELTLDDLTVAGTEPTDLFDDPAHGEPGRDRMAVHVAWEILLLVAVFGLAVGLHRTDPLLFSGGRVSVLLIAVVALGLIALAAGLSLRAAVPNLAVGPIAVAVALHVAEQGDQGAVTALVPVLVVAVAGGLLLAVLVVWFHVPGWAASLAAAAAVVAFIERRPEPVTVQGDHDLSSQASYLFAGLAAVALLGGLFGTIRTVRRSVGRFRPVADPARRRGVAAGFLATLALVFSVLLAAAAGVVSAMDGSAQIVPNSGLDWTVLAFGASLLGGTSAFGRRGGVAGTLLAVLLVVFLTEYAHQRNWAVNRWQLGAAAMVLGLLVTRVVERFGRPRSVFALSTDWNEGRVSSGWSLPRTSPPVPWSPPVPEQPAERSADTWRVDRWHGGATDWDGDQRHWG